MLEMVFVHLGAQLPQHLIGNLQIIRTNFPDLRIHLLVNQEHDLTHLRFLHVETHNIRIDKEIQDLLIKLSPDPKFRDGFWRLSLERLFTLVQFHDANPRRKFLHVESDVFIFPNFPIAEFERINKPAWIKVSHKRDVAAIVYLPSSHSTKKLGLLMKEELEKGFWIDDMAMLSVLMDANPEEFEYLPGINPSDLSLSSNRLTEELRLKICKNYEQFNGIFDGVHLGVWLAGWDPRNSYGVTRFKDSTLIENAYGLINPERVKFNYEAREFLTYGTNGSHTRIFCLHIHSKSLKIFSENWDKEMNRLVTLSQSSESYNEFSLSILLKLLRSNVRNRTIIPFLLQSTSATRQVLKIARQIRVKFTRGN